MTADTQNELETAEATPRGRKGKYLFCWRVDWDDPSVPAGDSPSLPRWPVGVALALWVAWLVALVSVS